MTEHLYPERASEKDLANGWEDALGNGWAYGRLPNVTIKKKIGNLHFRITRYLCDDGSLECEVTVLRFEGNNGIEKAKAWCEAAAWEPCKEVGKNR